MRIFSRFLFKGIIVVLTTNAKTQRMNFKRFQIGNIQVPDDVLFLHGSRNVRSRIIHNLLKKFKLYKGQVYTKTEEDKKYFKGWLNSGVYVSSNLKEDGVTYLLEKQSKKKDPAFLVFDNCFEDGESLDFIYQVCKKAKKYNVLVILSLNRGEDIPIDFNKVTTCAMLAENTNKYDRQELYNAFGGIFPTDKIFYKCFDYLTEDDNLMVICYADSTDLQDQVFWYPIEGTGGSKQSQRDTFHQNDNKNNTKRTNATGIDVEKQRQILQDSQQKSTNQTENDNDSNNDSTNESTDESTDVTPEADETGEEKYEERGECIVC